jgi:hypothetical protein
MQKQIIKQLGKQMREKIPLPNDLPLSIRKALQKLAQAESSRGCTPTLGITES